MESKEITSIEKPKTGQGRGGFRPGAGRKKGQRDQITVAGLLDQVYNQSGRDYDEILVGDFLQARQEGDKQTVYKYHNLILSKVMNSLAKIEVTDSEDAIASKKAAFAEALSKLTGVKEE